jgi:dCMP deaminase
MNKWDKRFLDMAKLVSTWSKDPSTQTGAVIVRPDKSIASVGFNGFPRAMPDTDKFYQDRTEKYSRIIHCEMNALNFVQDPKMQEYTLYTYPFLSCDRCYVHMIQSGISRFVAPICPPELEERWGEAFAKVRGYANESTGITIDELDYE